MRGDRRVRERTTCARRRLTPFPTALLRMNTTSIPQAASVTGYENILFRTGSLMSRPILAPEMARSLVVGWRRISPSERVPDTQRGGEDRVMTSYRAVKGAFRRASPIDDDTRVRRALDLIPDGPPPLHAAALDPDPPLLSRHRRYRSALGRISPRYLMVPLRSVPPACRTAAATDLSTSSILLDVASASALVSASGSARPQY